MEYGTIDSKNRSLTIREQQEYLNILARTHEKIPTVNPDGIAGPETEAAMRAFQKEFGIDAGEDGADYLSWKTLIRECRKEALKTGAGLGIYALPNAAVLDGIDRCPELIAVLQLMLDVLCPLSPELPDQNVDGRRDKAFLVGIRWIQRTWGLEETGEVDLQTYNALVTTFNDYMQKIE